MSFEVRKQDAIDAVNRRHADLLVDLTGNASIEERDTWNMKAEAAQAVLSGSANESQVKMLATEATIVGESVDDLVTNIIAKSVRFSDLVGLASGLRRKSLAALDACSTEEEISTVLATAEAEAEGYLAAL